MYITFDSRLCEQCFTLGPNNPAKFGSPQLLKHGNPLILQQAWIGSVLGIFIDFYTSVNTISLPVLNDFWPHIRYNLRGSLLTNPVVFGICVRGPL